MVSTGWLFSRPRVWLWVPLWILSWLASGAAALFGLAPEDVILGILGNDTVDQMRQEVAHMPSETARWVFLVFSHMTFGLGVLFLLIIPMAKIDRKSNDLRNEINELKETAAAVMREASRLRAALTRKERRIEKLHNQTRLMLQEIRKRKSGRGDGND
jgi:hypothetical protein